MRSIDPYENLANAVVQQAIVDYRHLWDRDIDDRDKKKIIKFFRSGWFVILTNVDPDWLIERLEKEADAKRKKTKKQKN